MSDEVVKITKYKGTIKLAKKVLQQIKWFTENWDNEICALGIGKMRHGEMFIERLVFPTQTVNGSHVHFKPEDWGTIIKDLSLEDLKNIIFYWHKHPDSSPGASDGDEDDTFDVFMDPKAGRTIFGFLQTSNSTSGMKYEARIEMRKPVWASIECNLVIDEDTKIEKECLKIIKDKVTKGTLGASDQPGVGKAEEPPITDEEINEQPETLPPYGIFKVTKEGKEVVVEFSPNFEDFLITVIEESDNLIKFASSFLRNRRWCKRLYPEKGKLHELFLALREVQVGMEAEDLESSLKQDDDEKDNDKKTSGVTQDEMIQETINRYNNWGMC